MITVRECQYDEVKKFRDLEGEYHYMGESHGAGDTIRLIFEETGRRERGQGPRFRTHVAARQAETR